MSRAMLATPCRYLLPPGRLCVSRLQDRLGIPARKEAGEIALTERLGPGAILREARSPFLGTREPRARSQQIQTADTVRQGRILASTPPVPEEPCTHGITKEVQRCRHRGVSLHQMVKGRTRPGPGLVSCR